MKISEMNKQQYIKYSVEEKRRDIDEVKAKWEEFEKEFKSKGIEGKELEERVKKRMSSFYMLLDKFPVEDCEAIFIGVIENDFGAKFQIKKALEEYGKDKETAIARGLTDVNGNPLKQTGFDKGSIIDLQKAIQRTYIGIVTLKGDKKIYNCEFVVAGDNLKLKVPLFKQITFKAGKSSVKSNDKKIVLNANQTTKIKVGERMQYDNIKEIIKNYFSNYVMSVETLKDYSIENKSNYDRMSIVVGDVFQLNDDSSRNGTILGINNGESMVTCYGLIDYPFEFNEMAQDIIVIGKPRYNEKKDECTMVLYGAIAPEMFRVEKKEYVEPVTKKQNVQKTDLDW